MDARTLVALEQSIYHWQLNHTGHTRAISCGDCALCRLFLLNTEPYTEVDSENLFDCHGCPVWQKTGKEVCVNTPYVSASKAFQQLKRAELLLKATDKPEQPEIDDFNKAWGEWIKASGDEVKFLVDLLPSEDDYCLGLA